MIRALNFCCFAITAFACLALYHVSEETRIARAQLHAVQRQIVGEKEAMKVLETDWQRASDPARIQKLASDRLGLDDAPTKSLASLELLPRRGAGTDLMTASSEQPAPPADAHLHEAALHTSE